MKIYWYTYNYFNDRITEHEITIKEIDSLRRVICFYDYPDEINVARLGNGCFLKPLSEEQFVRWFKR